MNKSDVLKLFMMMNNAYPNFEVDETKTAAWQEFLGDVPFETAKANLLRHIRTNSFQPTPADIIGQKEKQEGHYVPSIEETRLLLEEQKNWTSTPCPEHLKERLPWNL